MPERFQFKKSLHEIPQKSSTFKILEAGVRSDYSLETRTSTPIFAICCRPPYNRVTLKRGISKWHVQQS